MFIRSYHNIIHYNTLKVKHSGNSSALQSWPPAEILVKSQHVVRPLVPDGLACLVALEGEPQRWAPALALLSSRFPGEFDQDVCASGGFRAVLATVEKLHEEELVQDHMDAYIEAGKFMNEWLTAGRITALLLVERFDVEPLSDFSAK